MLTCTVCFVHAAMKFPRAASHSQGHDTSRAGLVQTSALWAGLGVALTAYATRSGLLALQAWTKAPRAFVKVHHSLHDHSLCVNHHGCALPGNVLRTIAAPDLRCCRCLPTPSMPEAGTVSTSCCIAVLPLFTSKAHKQVLISIREWY